MLGMGVRALAMESGVGAGEKPGMRGSGAAGVGGRKRREG